jgi:hypothetical protein
MVSMCMQAVIEKCMADEMTDHRQTKSSARPSVTRVVHHVTKVPVLVGSFARLLVTIASGRWGDGDNRLLQCGL